MRFPPYLSACAQVGVVWLAAILPASLLVAAEEPTPSTAGKRIVLAADPSTQRVGLVDDQKNLIWEYPIRDCFDATVLANGNILFQVSWARVLEVTPDKKIVWSYNARNQPGNDFAPRVQSVQRLDNGATLIAEAGSDRLVEVDAQENVQLEIPLLRLHPDFGQATFSARKLSGGTYLVAQGPDQAVWEYSAAGEVIWEYQAKAPVSSAQRLTNSNTLVACGCAGQVIEVSPAGDVVWQLKRSDLPNIVCIRSAERLANGNTLIVNSHAGATSPQILEVSPDKSVVWTFHDPVHFGNSVMVGRVMEQKDDAQEKFCSTTRDDADDF